MNIIIKVIPEADQRAEVNGCDWFWRTEYDCPNCEFNGELVSEPGAPVLCPHCSTVMPATETLQVRVSPQSDERYEILLAIHETCEAILCKYNGVTQAAVDAFDLEYDKTHTFDLNAGDDPGAPYAREHCFATAIERIMAAELGINWLKYDTELAQSYPGPSKKVVAIPVTRSEQEQAAKDDKGPVFHDQ